MPNSPHHHRLLWAALLVSLAINLALVYTLLSLRARAGEGARSAAQAVATLRTSSLDYTVRIENALPVSFTVPLSATVNAPLSFTLPIDTEFSMSVRTVLGDVPLTVPVRANVPVNISPRIPVSLTVPVSASVPVDMDVPIHIPLSATGLGGPLSQAQEYLERLAAELQGGLLP